MVPASGMLSGVKLVLIILPIRHSHSASDTSSPKQRKLLVRSRQLFEQCQSVNKLNCECAWPGATAVLCKSIDFSCFCGFHHPSKGMQYKVYLESGVF